MADFPAGDALAMKAELLINSVWTDITNYVRQDTEDGGFVTIERGTPDEGSGAKPSECKFELNDIDGRFSPRNPTGPYYGYLVRNTPMRVSVRTGERVLLVSGGASLDTPDGAAVSVTGDLDLRYEATLRSWGVTSSPVIKKGVAVGATQASYSLEILDTGMLRLWWSTTGSNFLSADSTLPPPLPWSGRKAIRATIDVDNGAAGRTITFYYSSDGTLSGTWVQIGSPVVQAGTTSIFDGTAAVQILCPGGVVHAAQIRNGIAGSIVANPSLAGQSEGATSFVCSAGRTWTPNTAPSASTAEITNRRQRFVGELADLPVSWEPSGADVWVAVTANGILRRLGQGNSELGGTYRRGVLADANVPDGYWPLEDLEGSETIASPVGGLPGRITGTPALATYGGFDCSAPIPTMGDGMVSMTPALVGSSAIASTQVRWLMNVPAAGSTNGALLIQFSQHRLTWQVLYGTGGSMELRCRLDAGAASTTLATTGVVAFQVDGRQLLCSVELTTSGADISAVIATLEVGATSGATSGVVVTGEFLMPVRGLSINPNRTHTDVAMGHVLVQPAVDSLFSLAGQLSAFAGERAAVRVQRLAEEEGIPTTYYGTAYDDSVAMGVQLPGSLLELLTECADADGGVVIEPRDLALPGIGFVGRSSLHRREVTANGAGLAVAYGTACGLRRLEPRDDDQTLRNDITVTRANGSSFRATRTDGPLAVATVGRYDDGVTLNLETDDQLGDAANWRLHRGSGVDTPRWPAIGFDLSRAGEASAITLAQLVALDIGSRLQVSGLPTFFSPESADVLLMALAERLGPNVWDLELTTVPALVYDVGVYDIAATTTSPRYSGYGTTAGMGIITSTATTLFINTTPIFPLAWAHDDGDYLILVGGETMLVTAVSGSAPSQQLTVVRSQNGVVKSHPANTPLDLYRPVYYAV